MQSCKHYLSELDRAPVRKLAKGQCEYPLALRMMPVSY